MAAQDFTLTSPAFGEGQHIPPRHTCEGEDLSPRLEWTRVPPQTRSFALIMDDPDAPSGTFTHWLLADIPAEARELREAEDAVGVAGRNDFGGTGWGGPCPPPKHGDHRYNFRLLALDLETTGLAAGASRADFEAAIDGHVLGEATLMGRFARG
jgi:hypothetical protein